MTTVALVSTVGGVGRTTLTAALATLAARGGAWSLALECDPQNLLAMHFGGGSPPVDGLVSCAMQGRPWHTAALQASDRALVLPFGAMDAAALSRCAEQLASEPDWLASRLDELERPSASWTFIDAARAPSVFAQQALRAADLVLLVLRAEGQSFALLERALEQLGEAADRGAPGKPVLAVVNMLEPAQILQQDLLAVFQQRLGSALAPSPVHRDQAVPEAFASRAAVPDRAPHSQVAFDLRSLMDWLRQQWLQPAAGALQDAMGRPAREASVGARAA